jgi:hypothetical protein
MKCLMRWGESYEIIKGGLGVLGFLTLGSKLGCYKVRVQYEVQTARGGHESLNGPNTFLFSHR